VRERDNKNWPEQDCFVLTWLDHQNAPLLRKKRRVSRELREGMKTEPSQILTFITRAPRLDGTNLRMHGTNVEEA